MTNLAAKEHATENGNVVTLIRLEKPKAALMAKGRFNLKFAKYKTVQVIVIM